MDYAVEVKMSSDGYVTRAIIVSQLVQKSFKAGTENHYSNTLQLQANSSLLTQKSRHYSCTGYLLLKTSIADYFEHHLLSYLSICMLLICMSENNNFLDLVGTLTSLANHKKFQRIKAQSCMLKSHSGNIIPSLHYFFPMMVHGSIVSVGVLFFFYIDRIYTCFNSHLV